MIAKILQTQENMGRDEITFQFITDDGIIVSTCVELRTKGEDHQAWLDSRTTQVQEQYDLPEPSSDDLLLATILSYDPTTIQDVLGVDVAQVEQLSILRANPVNRVLTP